MCFVTLDNKIAVFLLEPSGMFRLKNRGDIKVVMPDECDDEGFVVDESDGDEFDLSKFKRK